MANLSVKMNVKIYLHVFIFGKIDKKHWLFNFLTFTVLGRSGEKLTVFGLVFNCG